MCSGFEICTKCQRTVSMLPLQVVGTREATPRSGDTNHRWSGRANIVERQVRPLGDPPQIKLMDEDTLHHESESKESRCRLIVGEITRTTRNRRGVVKWVPLTFVAGFLEGFHVLLAPSAASTFICPLTSR